MIDGCALLWIQHWPAIGKISDFVASFKKHIGTLLDTDDIHLVFDRYREYSTKSVTRQTRAGKKASRVHQLTLNTELVSQKVVLLVTANKIQLINIICADIRNDVEFHKAHTQNQRLVVTGQDDTPFDISDGGVVHLRHEMKTFHEQADNIVVQQSIMAGNGNTGVSDLCDDTNVFVLLLYHYQSHETDVSIPIKYRVHDRAGVYIRATVAKHKAICLYDL